jgi:hypothetical protein
LAWSVRRFPFKRSRVTVLFDPDSSTTEVCLCRSTIPLLNIEGMDANLLLELGGAAAINAVLEYLVRRQNRFHINSRAMFCPDLIRHFIITTADIRISRGRQLPLPGPL